MSNIYPPAPSSPERSSSTASATADAAKEQASKVASDAAEAGKNVAGTAKEQASTVASEAKTQAKDLIKQTQSELREQAGVQQERVATGLRSLSDELGSMAENSTGGGIAADLVQQVASRAGGVASWLDERDPGALLEEVKTFARNKPGTFIGIAAVAGIIAGRLTRSLTSAAADEKEAAASAPASAPASTPAASTPVAPVTPAEPVTPVTPFTAGANEPVVAGDSLYTGSGAASVDPDLGAPTSDDPYYRAPRS
ncbi:MAG: hypothetical protein ABWY54_07395 [Glaciihabitans sp.]